MLKLNLQTFGGRGSSGGKRSGGGGGSTPSTTESVLKAAEKQFSSGTYLDEYGEELEIEYRVSGTKVQQEVNGKPYGGEIRINPDGGFKYEARDTYGTSFRTNNVTEASKWAFGNAKDDGLRKMRR